MSRDDSLLYSGSSSASFGSTKQQQVREIKSEQKKEQRTKLQPAAEVVFAEIEKEKQASMYLPNIDVERAADEKAFMIEAMARKKYTEYLTRLQNKLDNILREPKRTLKAKPLKEDDEA